MELYTDISSRCQALRADMTFKNIFELTCSQPERIAAHWLEGDEERSATFGDYRRMAMNYAQTLRSKLGEARQGSFVAIQVDTCKEWFSLFWGLLMAGYNPLLLNAGLNEEMTAFMLGEAGASGVVYRGRRKLPGQVVQVDADALFNSPDAAEAFEPCWADKVALCTSGSTATSRIFVYDQVAVCEQVLNSDLLRKANPRIVNTQMQRNLAFLPFHHIFGFMVCVMWCNFGGYETVYIKDRAPETILGAMRRFKVNFLCAVPVLANSLSNGLNKKVAQQKPLRRFAFRLMKYLSLGLQSVAPRLAWISAARCSSSRSMPSCWAPMSM